MNKIPICIAAGCWISIFTLSWLMLLSDRFRSEIHFIFMVAFIAVGLAADLAATGEK